MPRSAWADSPDPLEVYLPSTSAEGVRRRIKRMEENYLQTPPPPPAPTPSRRVPPGDETDESDRRTDEYDDAIDDSEPCDDDDDECDEDERPRGRRRGRRAQVEVLLNQMARDYAQRHGVSYSRAYERVLKSKIGQRLYGLYTNLMPTAGSL
jgi:hypothetical protein